MCIEGRGEGEGHDRFRKAFNGKEMRESRNRILGRQEGLREGKKR